jgi:excisionase family DNA binding protein
MLTKEGSGLMTVSEVPKVFRCYHETVRHWIKSRKLPAVAMPAGSYPIRLEDVNKILSTNY